MKFESAAIIAFIGMASAAPVAKSIPVRMLRGREVPQEHSHNKFLATVRTSLATNNPKNIQDPVFGLLGDAAAAAGAGDVTDLACLQQETADQAFTNAKAAGDVDGMVAALQYRAIERNTGSVGLASATCTETAANAEIDAVSQHQDPASDNAAATNKAIVLALAQQIAAVGGDPQLALETGTFAPGTVGDPTAAGNTCDTEDDTEGCIFTQNLLVEDATAAEISSAVAGVSATAAAAASSVSSSAAASSSAASSSSSAAATTSAAGCAASSSSSSVAASSTSSVASSSASSSAATASATASAASGNSQTFTGTLGGAAPAVTASGDSTRPFEVNGDTFVNASAAIQRSCSIQHNACADAANSGTLTGGEAQCETQEEQCNALISA